VTPNRADATGPSMGQIDPKLNACGCVGTISAEVGTLLRRCLKIKRIPTR
jgi:hypothetical protein